MEAIRGYYCNPSLQQSMRLLVEFSSPSGFLGLWSLKFRVTAVVILVLWSQKWPCLDDRLELGRISWLDLTDNVRAHHDSSMAVTRWPCIEVYPALLSIVYNVPIGKIVKFGSQFVSIWQIGNESSKMNYLSNGSFRVCTKGKAEWKFTCFL